MTLARSFSASGFQSYQILARLPFVSVPDRPVSTLIASSESLDWTRMIGQDA